MREYILSPRSIQDLFEIWSFIAQDSPGAADQVCQELYEAIERIAEMPRMGHVRGDLVGESLRVWPVRSFLIVYRPEASPVEIVRVLSGYRDIFGLYSKEEW